MDRKAQIQLVAIPVVIGLAIVAASGTGTFSTALQSETGDSQGIADQEKPELEEQDGLLFSTSGGTGFCTDQYDNCNDNSHTYVSVTAYSVLEYDNLDYIGVDDGVYVVEPGTTVPYRCRKVGSNTVDTDAALMDAQDQAPQISVDNGQSIEIVSGNTIGLTGEISVDFAEPRSVQLVCASVANDGTYWAYSSSWSWFNNEIRSAVDSDGDGVFDINDACPDRGDEGFGLKDDGCPIVDSDGDGVPDPEDACPSDAGGELGVDDRGCPINDSDGDGVIDRDDACPEEYGSKEDGCPTLLEPVTRFLGTAWSQFVGLFGG